MIKKEVVSSPKVNKAEAFRCGECLHFKQTPHRTHKTVCSNEGIRSFAEAPRCYTPDYTKVIGNTDEFVSIITFFASKTPQQKKILLGMLRTQPSGKRLRLGTKIFFNLRNREYVNNYVTGFVVGYTSSGEVVLAGSPERSKRGQVFFAYLQTDKSLLTPKEWRVRYSEMVAKGRLVDPTAKSRVSITASIKEDTYEVPSIDNAPKGEGKSTVKKLNKRTSPVGDLMFSF